MKFAQLPLISLYSFIAMGTVTCTSSDEPSLQENNRLPPKQVELPKDPELQANLDRSLLSAASGNRYEDAKAALDLGANPDVCDFKGRNSLGLAAYHHDNKILKLLLERGAKGFDSKWIESDFYTFDPLIQAICRNNLEGVRLFLDYGAPADDVEFVKWAMWPEANVEIFSLLLERGLSADRRNILAKLVFELINMPDEDKCRAYFDVLLKHGLDLKDPSFHTNSPLPLCCNSLPSIAEYLLKLGVDPSWTYKGESAFDVATHEEMRVLLEKYRR